MLETLEPLAALGEPWRIIALEFTAAAHVRAGDEAAGIEALTSMIEDENATPAIQARAREMIAAFGGTPPEPGQTALQSGNGASSSDASEEGEEQ